MDGYPLKSSKLAKELEKRSQRAGASKKHATIVAKFKVKKVSPPSVKKVGGSRAAR